MEKIIKINQLHAIAHRNMVKIDYKWHITNDFGELVPVNYEQTLVSMSTCGWPEDKWWLRGARRWR